MEATRERKERFILSFGKINGQTGNDAVSNILRVHGLELFEDWAIDIMVRDLIGSAREATKRNAENRRIWAAYQRRSDNRLQAVG